jgi:hypothetical protein
MHHFYSETIVASALTISATLFGHGRLIHGADLMVHLVLF